MQPDNNQPMSPMDPPSPMTPPPQEQPSIQPSDPVVDPPAAANNSLLGAIGLGLAVVGVILMPIIQVEASSYWMLLIPFAIGLVAAAVGILASKKVEGVSTMALSGLILGLIVASMSFVNIVRTYMVEQKYESLTQPTLEITPRVEE